ncbi:oxidoreductase [Escherichia coli]|nr:oxidoreductase [Escherichia coli]
MSHLKDPTTQYYTGEYPKQKQPTPGIQAKMTPVPDCGEKTYVGSGRLKDRKALVTGGDSGIGRAAAIAYAREGADVAISYLPVEEEDAQDVKKIIEECGRKAVLLPGDLSDEKFARSLVHEAHKALGGLDIMALVAGKQVAIPDIADLTSEQFPDGSAPVSNAPQEAALIKLRLFTVIPPVSQRYLSFADDPVHAPPSR